MELGPRWPWPRLIETIEAAIQHPAELAPDEIRFGVTSLIAVGEDLPAFVNQYSLGVGWDAARVIVMGTEPAENPDVPEDMAWHAIYSVLVAANSRPEILDRIVDGSSWMAGAEGGWNSRDKRPYHLNANDFIHVERRRGSSTWKVIPDRCRRRLDRNARAFEAEPPASSAAGGAALGMKSLTAEEPDNLFPARRDAVLYLIGLGGFWGGVAVILIAADGGQGRRRVGVQRRAEGPRGGERGGHRRNGHRRPARVVDVPSREEALEWAAKIAVACRCAQKAREFVPDPSV